MIKACLPDLPLEEQRLLLGADPAESADGPGAAESGGIVARGFLAHFVA